ncbi:hypothetical protein GQ457_05G014050 [Hibiscus cannabinus]
MSDSCLSSTVVNSSDSSMLWHARLGHSSSSTMNKLSQLHCNSSQSDHIKHCGVCPLAKQSRLPFPISSSRESIPFSIIHIDLWGAYRVSTHSGHRYFLTIVDDHSRMTWVYLLRFKNDAIVVLKQFIAYVQTHFSVSVKTIRSDNGSEFFNTEGKEFFSSKGIVHQSSCVHTPQQNGVAERKHQHLLNVARALKFQSSVPIKFWGECILTACYLINRLPSSVLGWKSPFEMFYHKVPNLSHLRVFGCLCYATMLNDSDKFHARAIPSIFMGYSIVQKGYLLFNIKSRKFFVSRDVVFHEQIFPFQKSDSVVPLFPLSTNIVDSDCDFLHIPVVQDDCTSVEQVDPNLVSPNVSPMSHIESPPVSPVSPISPITQTLSTSFIDSQLRS